MSKKQKQNDNSVGFIDVGSMIVCAFAIILTFIDHIYFSACAASDVHYIPDFIGGFRLCARYTPLWVGAILILFSPMFLFKREGRRLWAIGTYLLYTFLTLVDLAYLRAFNTIPSFAVIKFIPNTASMDLETVARLSRYDFILLAGFLILVILCFKLRQISNAIFQSFGKRIGHALALCLVCVVAVSIIPVANKNGGLQQQYADAYRPDNIQNEACSLSVVGYHADDLWHFIRGREEMTEQDENDLRAYYAWKNKDSSESELTNAYKGKNLIIIQAESLENFVIGARFDGYEITPNINALLGESIYFPNIYQQIKSGGSIDCDFMVATSLLPTSYGAVFPDRLGDSFTTFAQNMKSAGYRTDYYNVTAQSAWDYEDAVCDSLHYDNLISEEYGDLKEEETLNGYMSDAVMLEKTAKFLIESDKFDQPYFAHIVLASSHLPFNIPEYLSSIPDEKRVLRDTTVYDYLCLMHYVDDAIGDFIKTIDEAGMLDDTVIVIYGDHGGIHRYYPVECNRLAKKEGCEWIGEATVPTVPMIVYSRGSEAKRCDVYGGQIDIMPTLASLFGVEKGQYALGRDLLSTKRNFVLTTDGKILCGGDYEIDDEGARLVSKLWRLSEKMIDNDKC